MNINERKQLSAVINYFWGAGTATPQSINDKAALVAYEALEQAKICSDTMDLVPRPTYGPVNIKWVVKQLSKIGKRIVIGDSAVYKICKSQISLGYKTRIRLALMGM